MATPLGAPLHPEDEALVPEIAEEPDAAPDAATRSSCACWALATTPIT